MLIYSLGYTCNYKSQELFQTSRGGACVLWAVWLTYARPHRQIHINRGKWPPLSSQFSSNSHEILQALFSSHGPS